MIVTDENDYTAKLRILDWEIGMLCIGIVYDKRQGNDRIRLVAKGN
jgi:hypothetical protein